MTGLAVKPFEGLDYRINPTTHVRIVGGADGRRVRGVAIVFDTLSEDLGFFREQIAPEAVDRTLREALDVRALVDHDPSKILGRTRAGTLRLDKTKQGLETLIDPPSTTAANDILESVRRGDVTGMSFAFKTLEDQWDLKTDPPTRTVLDMIISDVSIVTYPAYPSTEVAVRSLRTAQAAHPSTLEQRRSLLAMTVGRSLPGLELRGAIPSHSTATSDAAWDGPAAKANLSNDAGAALYRKAFAWVDSDEDPDVKSSYKGIHHEVSSASRVGAANIKACQSLIGILNGGRGGMNIPDADRQGVWNHVARHLRDAGLEPAPLS